MEKQNKRKEVIGVDVDEESESVKRQKERDKKIDAILK